MSTESLPSSALGPSADTSEVELASFTGAAVVQLVWGEATSPGAVVSALHPATVTVTNSRVLASDGKIVWAWLLADLEAVTHSAYEAWTILAVPGIPDYGVSLPDERIDEFREVLGRMVARVVRMQRTETSGETASPEVPTLPLPVTEPVAFPAPSAGVAAEAAPPEPSTASATPHGLTTTPAVGNLAGLDAREISAWFGTHQVLDRVSLNMPAGQVTALIGPSGCGKSTFLRILNRMHEMIPVAKMSGQVMLDGHDIYDPHRKLTDARREIGMVFQKPNPFPAMSIYDNVLASLQLTGTKATTAVKDELVESCLTKAGLWNEVRDRLRKPGGGLSGGQQQRLCIARALAIKPRVLLMDEPCSALDPTSTRRIEETVMELASEVTIVIVTHNMQQALRVSDQCAFFLAEQGTPGVIVEYGPTEAMFGWPQDRRTEDYVKGRFG